MNSISALAAMLADFSVILQPSIAATVGLGLPVVVHHAQNEANSSQDHHPATR
jgi:hypothetical protein